MGGLYGNATATALEDCPERARGLVSGIYQCGYSTGWLLAIAFSKIFVDASSSMYIPTCFLPSYYFRTRDSFSHT
jgi:MFS transporter, SHS family, lactate transporter